RTGPEAAARPVGGDRRVLRRSHLLHLRHGGERTPGDGIYQPSGVSRGQRGVGRGRIAARGRHSVPRAGAVLIPSMDPAPDTRALGRSLIDTFARGWMKSDALLQASIFAPDAVFLETPFSEPIVGVEEIRMFWGDAMYHQVDVTVTTGEIYAA